MCAPLLTSHNTAPLLVPMNSIRPPFTNLGLRSKPPGIPAVPRPAPPPSGLRDGSRGPLWRGRMLSSEAIQAVQALKLAAKPPPGRTQEVLNTRVSRLLKADAMAVLAELQRQNEWEIALQVFAFIQQEVWYKPDLSLYSNMIFMLGKNKLIEFAEQIFLEIKRVGLLPDTRAYTEMIGAYMQVGMVEKAMNVYSLMKESGCDPDKLTLTVLIRNLEKAGEEILASAVRKDCAEYMEYPRRFLKEVDRKHQPKRSHKLKT